MSALPITVVVRIESETCVSCGLVFGMSEEFKKKRRELGDVFHCPAGHRQYYGETSVDKLKKELELEKRRLKWAQDARDAAMKRADREERSKRAVSGHMTRIKHRISAGVCPCCNRTFVNLQRHMATKHKGYRKEKHA
jgi:hypothetical protein